MAAARGAGKGLSTADVESIRTQLSAGRRPRVVFTASAGQMAGQTGQVVALTDAQSSDDFVVVRFGRDELPFSPADLAIPPRGSGSRRAEPKAAAPPAPELKLTEPPVPTPREEPSMPRSTVDSSAKAAPAKAQPVAPQPAATQSPEAPAEPPARPRKATRQARPKGPAGLTVTLAYADGEWTVAANQGAKSLAKPYLIKPSDALKMVALLDVAGVQEAVEQIVSAERAEAEQQAERLRAELAEIEARLAELRDAG
jgi:hypothetical protein